MCTYSELLSSRRARAWSCTRPFTFTDGWSPARRASAAAAAAGSRAPPPRRRGVAPAPARHRKPRSSGTLREPIRRGAPTRRQRARRRAAARSPRRAPSHAGVRARRQARRRARRERARSAVSNATRSSADFLGISETYAAPGGRSAARATASQAPAPRVWHRGNTRMAPSLVLRLVASAEPYSTRCSSAWLAPRSVEPPGRRSAAPEKAESAQLSPPAAATSSSATLARNHASRCLEHADATAAASASMMAISRWSISGLAPGAARATHRRAARAVARGAQRHEATPRLQRRRAPATPRPLRRRVPRRFPRLPSRAARVWPPPLGSRRGTGRTARRRPARAALGASTPRGTPPAAARSSPRTRIPRLTHLTRGWDRSRGLVVLRKNRRLTFRLGATRARRRAPGRDPDPSPTRWKKHPRRKPPPPPGPPRRPSPAAARTAEATTSSSSACGSADFLPMRHSSQHECRCARSAAASVQPSATSAQKQLQYPRASSGLRGDAWARFSSDSSFDSNDARVCDSAFSRATAATSVSNARRRSGTPRSPKPSAAAFSRNQSTSAPETTPVPSPGSTNTVWHSCHAARDAARYPALAAAAPFSGAAAARDAAASACAARRGRHRRRKHPRRRGRTAPAQRRARPAPPGPGGGAGARKARAWPPPKIYRRRSSSPFDVQARRTGRRRRANAAGERMKNECVRACF